ncbi:hypothetical protein [Streptomyces sp. NBC_00233]|uniref:hypothetical protein n=1 Tax=Streptomyces sp. NBC_00233 TaxID=2975686 RepID=UPI002259E7C9|nr:hypothetical protein [Streptomyces sp. NBC_00233]MCX5230868.1 hypothetical protein [Streptomyces sp. NBC_00233]
MATAHGGTSAGTPKAKHPRRTHGPATPSPTPAAAYDLDLLRRTLSSWFSGE